MNLNMMSFDQDYYENVQKTKDGEYEITDANNWAEPAMAFVGKNGIGDQGSETHATALFINNC